MSTVVTPLTNDLMPFHPAADLFPLMAGADFDALVEDIKTNGLREEIVMFEEKVLDGRNRLLACQKAGVKPEFRWVDENDDPIALVISLNLFRRHLTTSQRAMIAEKITTLRQGQKKADASIEASAQPEAAALLHVSRASVQRARVVRAEATPEDVKAVETGTTTINKVLKQVRPPSWVKSARAVRAYSKPPREGMRLAGSAMGKLNEIREDDLEREQAYAYCLNWIEVHVGTTKRPKKTAAPLSTKKPTKKPTKKRAEKRAEHKAYLARMKAMKPGEVTTLCEVCRRIFTSSNPCPDHATPTTSAALLPKAAAAR